MKITVAQAASLMSKSTLFVREAMRREVLDIGTAMQMPGSTKWTFHISPTKLAEYLGLSLNEMQERIDACEREHTLA